MKNHNKNYSEFYMVKQRNWIMKGKTALSVCFAIIFTFSLFLLFQNQFPDTTSEMKNHEFFDKEFNENEKIFLIGSSHVGYLNSTHIVQKISNFNSKFEVYNLAYDTDNPEIRSKSIEKIISLNPKIIFYGISYRDFETNVEQEFSLPNTKDFIGSFYEVDKINPRLITFKAIKSILDYSNIFPNSSQKITFINTPFITPSISTTIIPNDNELEKEITKIISQKNFHHIDLQGNNIKKFIEIIEKLEKKGITLVVYLTPLHPKYIEQISNDEKKKFKLIISKINEHYEIKIYDFINNYAEQNIWLNLSHISINEKSIFYSDDIANMIISELDE